MGPYNDLLRWLSENRCGPWGALKSVANWLLPGQEYVSRVVDDLSSLGHLEMDWAQEQWTVAPPAVVTLPFSGLRAVLAGRRLPPLIEAIASGEVFEDLDIWVDERTQKGGPDVIYFSTSRQLDIPTLAARLGVQFSDYPALRLVRALPMVGQDGAESPPPVVESGEQWDGIAMRWRPLEKSGHAGLFRVDAYGRWRHVLSKDGVRYWHTDLSAGRYAELARVGRSVVTYQAEGISGTLVVPVNVPLPTLHARVATLCTGTLPSNDGKVLRYRNVPPVLAQAIATSVGQVLPAMPDMAVKQSSS